MKVQSLTPLLMFAFMATQAEARPPEALGAKRPTVDISGMLVRDLDNADLFKPQFERSLKSVSFKPFIYKDPRTGKTITGETLIELPNGKKVTAAQYYTELNQHEQFLAEQGYSLQDDSKDDLGTVQKAASTKSLTLSQMNLIRASVKAPQIEVKELDKHLLKPVFALHPGILSGITPKPTTPTGNCTSKDTLRKSESWPRNFGDDAFNLKLNAAVTFEATCNRVAGTAEAGADGTLFSKGFNLAKGKALAEAVRDKHYKVDLDVIILNKKIFDYDKTQANSYSAGDRFSKSIPVEISAKIPVGPIRLSMKAGARGAATFEYKFKFDGLSALAVLEPVIESHAFAEAGANAVVAEAGAGADLLLASLKLPMSALAEVKPQAGRFVAHGKIFGQLILKALDGKIYAYVKIWAPSWSNPFRMKTYRIDITDWDGWIMNMTLFNVESTINLI